MHQLDMLRGVASRGGLVNWDDVIVKGTCTVLLKDYYRLNEVPNPNTVRPVPVLMKAVEALVLKHANEPYHSKLYSFLNNQYKAIRQDLTVQHVKSEFVAQVYEQHARICLEYEDIPEVNQCQTQLHELYNMKLKGKIGEFTAYRILYNVYISAKYKHGSYAMHEILTDASALGVTSDAAVVHALHVRESVEMCDYYSFFNLLRNAPNMSATMMALLVGLMRHKAMRFICRAYMPSVDIVTVSNLLGFGVEETGVAACKAHLDACCFEGESKKEESHPLPPPGLRGVKVEGGGSDGGSERVALAGVVFKDAKETLVDTKLTLAKGYFTIPYMFKIMDGDSVTG